MGSLVEAMNRDDRAFKAEIAKEVEDEIKFLSDTARSVMESIITGHPMKIGCREGRGDMEAIAVTAFNLAQVMLAERRLRIHALKKGKKS